MDFFSSESIIISLRQEGPPLFTAWFWWCIAIPNHTTYGYYHAKYNLQIQSLFAEKEKP